MLGELSTLGRRDLRRRFGKAVGRAHVESEPLGFGSELFVQRRTADEKTAGARTGEGFSVGELR